MDAVYKLYLKGIREELAGCAKITPDVIRKKLGFYSLNMQIRESSCRLKLRQECGFCQVKIRQGVYLSVDESLIHIQGKVGFCFKGLIAYDIGGEWITDTEKEYLVIYEPFAEEVNVIYWNFVSTRRPSPRYKFWSRSNTNMYFIKAQDGIALYRQFLIKGDSLVASNDMLMFKNNEADTLRYYYFAPMSFVYDFGCLQEQYKKTT